ncbi:TrbI/VirB10 family protein [Hydrogenophaga sp. 5NK40-0174]|uniref:TrbI/VirB10 family protein n=1 Tax=Hydrogenophaga sp. 5NK40-0174 TaxID=3127649 RepID=UPI00310668BD
MMNNGNNAMQMPDQNGAAAPQMNDTMPRLNSGVGRGVNKMALGYIGAVAIGVVAMSMWVANVAFSADDKEKNRVVFEDVEVPNKPVLRLPEEPMLAEPPVQMAAIKPPPVPKPAGPEKPDDLLMRRMASQNNLIPETEGRNTENRFFEDEFSSVKRGAVQVMANADMMLTRGTFIRCALQTRVVSTLPGMTSCVVTEPIYSTNGRRLLIDKGSKVTGEYKYVDENYDRIGIVWTRILTTTGLDVRIDSAGTDTLGGAGVPGEYDGHWGERIGSAMLVSLLADTIDVASQKIAEKNDIKGQSSTVYGNGYVAQTYDPWKSRTADTAQAAATQMLARSANRKATVTVMNGTVINIFTARDVDFSTVLQ